MDQRKNDPVIISIHDRLDTLEELASDLKEIKQWIATVVRMTLIIEKISDFVMKWVWLLFRFVTLVGIIWAAIKFGATEGLLWLRGMIIK